MEMQALPLKQQVQEKAALTTERYFNGLLKELERAEEKNAARKQGTAVEEFDIRGRLYNLALQLAPKARVEDIRHTLRWLDLKRGEVGADVAAGTGFLTFALAKKTGSMVYAIDPSKEQLKALDRTRIRRSIPTSLITTIHGSPDDPNFLQGRNEMLLGGADYITSFGGLHHSKDHETMFRNMAMMLLPGGRIVAADVGAGTPLADYFDSEVKFHCLTGHTGNWLSHQRLEEICSTLPLELTKTEIVPIKWKFKNALTMYLFFVGLHGYPRGYSFTEVIEGLEKHLRFERERKGAPDFKLNWPMLFFDIRRTRGKIA